MTNIGLHVGLKALLTAQSALDTVGHNISNANTPGYSRQSLSLSAARPLQLRGLVIGNGVAADGIHRTVDDLLGRRIVSQIASLQKLDAALSGMTRVEAMLGEPGGLGIGGLLDELFARFSDLSASPEDRVLRTGVAQGAETLATRFHEVSGDLAQVAQDAVLRVDASLERANTVAEKIASLNVEIAKIEASGEVANDARDERDEALRLLAEELDITYQEEETGAVRVFVDGQILVGIKTSHALSARPVESGVEVWIEGSTAPIHPRSGRVAGSLQLVDSFVPELAAKVDRLARGLIFESNRVHSTGIPSTGGFQRLAGSFSVQDVDGDGLLTDGLLSDTGLAFPVQDGELYVNVRNEATGAFTTTRIPIEAERTTVGDLLDALNAIPGLGAALDARGRFQIVADGGSTFDFGRRLNGVPDAIGSFGGARASLGTTGAEPFGLATGDTLTLQGPLGNFTITFDATDFADIAEASAEEVVAVINADPNVAANGMVASIVGDRVVVQTLGEGASESFQVVGGTALGAFGWTAGQLVSGQDTAVSVTIGGAYGGSSNQRFTFTALADGQIGTTSSLQVEVRDEAGALVATLEVGQGYVPGTELDLGDGVRVSFGAGSISATDNDVFSLHHLGDSDTSDVLVALGLNSFFDGTDASSIRLRADLARDPMGLATSGTGASGDNRTVLDLVSMQHSEVESLGTTLGGFYGDVVGELGFEVGSTSSALEVDRYLVDDLEARRQQTSGVNVDEELVPMMEFEQAFGAAAQYIQVVNSLSEELLALV